MKKRKIKWKVAIPMAVLALLVLYLVLSLVIGLFTKKPSESNMFTPCNLTGKQTLKILENEDRTNVAVVKDYNFYGESLNLYYEVYDRNMAKSGTLDGKQIVLIDMCSDNKITFDISRNLDAQIDIAKLKPGFYSIYTLEGEKYTRLYADKSITRDNVLYSVTRNGKRIRVELVANQKLFDAEGATESRLDRPYLYLNVTSEAVSEETSEYDLVIITAPALTLDHVSPVGESANGIVEATELQAVADQLKNILTEKGLKVNVIKGGGDEYLKYYGKAGVVGKAYNSGAKYAIYLDMVTLDYEILMVHSSYVSDSFASSVFSKLKGIGLYSGNELTKSNRLDGDSGEADAYFEIRELGGVGLGTGTFSSTSAQNADYKNYKKGINAIEIITTNIRNASSVSLWNQKKADMAKAIAEGVLEYLGR